MSHAITSPSSVSLSYRNSQDNFCPSFLSALAPKLFRFKVSNLFLDKEITIGIFTLIALTQLQAWTCLAWAAVN